MHSVAEKTKSQGAYLASFPRPLPRKRRKAGRGPWNEARAYHFWAKPAGRRACLSCAHRHLAQCATYRYV